MAKPATATKRPATKRVKAVAAEPIEIIAYKGFDKNLQCRGFQYEIGKTAEHKGSVIACLSGLHSCENPLDVLSYYDLGGDNRFCRVSAGGTVARHEGGSKIASATLTVQAELRLPDFIKAGIAWVAAACKADDKTEITSGNYAKNASSGNYAKNASSGDNATNASSGDNATNEATGADSVIAAAGLGSMAKGAAGTAIALPYRDSKDQIRFAHGVAGEDGVPAGKWLVARDGKLVEA